ncbi:PAS domain-containing protein [Emcibacter sp.]|uniref:PAS domain-containing protein n=1 Tax=Emcibacter sp. TaxID=1979954 RepID=UPI003A90B295
MAAGKNENSRNAKDQDSSYLLVEAPLTDISLVESPRLREILKFWESQKRGDDVPLWKSFNPMNFPDILPTISVFSNEGTLDEPDYLLRVEGEQSARIMDLPTSMTRVRELDSYFSNTRLREHLDIMAREKMPIYFIRNMGWREYKDYINYEILCMPFATQENGPVDRFLSTKTFNQKPLKK